MIQLFIHLLLKFKKNIITVSSLKRIVISKEFTSEDLKTLIKLSNSEFL